ncbi:MAG: 4-hydroxythreonine-4-phosphate dehydrogenase PdxA, partial [Actinomycetia bacterium]|nr:4-hydroxythreonine-4-phosphate dehydrogenase PdxA [Actinomycetes bacterium]
SNESWKDRIVGIVTLPVNKYYLSLINKNFTGHTEFFGEYFSSEKYSMILHSESITVLPVTRHIRISKVAENLDEEDIFLSIKNGFDFIRQIRFGYNANGSELEQGKSQPKIAVLALNPHASDSGLIGDEEIKVITPAILRAKSAGINVEGPISGDTAFIPKNLRRYDIFIGMFHDQVLIPFKMLSFGKGVNVTYNLPVIRTSVDHGTGYDIAGSQIADTGSFELAYKTAMQLASELVKSI